MPYFNSSIIASELGITLPHEIKDIETVCETLEQELKNMGIIYEDTPTPRTFKLRGSVNGKSLFQFPANLSINQVVLKRVQDDMFIKTIPATDYTINKLSIKNNPIHQLELNKDNWIGYENYLEVILQGGYGQISAMPSSLITLCKLEAMMLVNAIRNATTRNVQQTVSSTTIGKVSTSFKVSNSETQADAVSKLRQSIYSNHCII